MSHPISSHRLAAAAALLLCWGVLAVVDAGRSVPPAVATATSGVRRLSATGAEGQIHPPRPAFLATRGGATLAQDDEYDSEDEYDEYDDEKEDDDEEEAASALAAAAKAKVKAAEAKARAKSESLSKSAVRAAAKAQAKKTSRAKEAVSVTLTPKKKRRGSILKALRVPYILRAFLNPLTVIAMTRAYFASLFDINYLEEESSQGLRSALEEKAKKEDAAGGGGKKGGGGRKGKRIMKPGQAKTLSDLPQLSA